MIQPAAAVMPAILLAQRMKYDERGIGAQFLEDEVERNTGKHARQHPAHSPAYFVSNAGIGCHVDHLMTQRVAQRVQWGGASARLQEQRIATPCAEPGMHIEREDVMRVREILPQPLHKQPGPLFERASAKEESAWKLVLAAGDRLLERAEAMAKGLPQRPQVEEVAARLRGRIEDAIDTRVDFRSARPAFALGKEIAIEIDVVLVRAAQPRHPVGIEHMHEHDCAVGRQLGRLLQQRQLNCGPGECFHTVQPARM